MSNQFSSLSAESPVDRFAILTPEDLAAFNAWCAEREQAAVEAQAARPLCECCGMFLDLCDAE